MKPLPLAAVLLALFLAACGASPSDGASAAPGAASGQAARSTEPAVVVGTVLDALTRRPEPGVQVRAPDGRTATSDAAGRFELRGLAVGSSGELVATSPDGRAATVRLRPLAPGRLEVVLHLRRAPEDRRASGAGGEPAKRP